MSGGRVVVLFVQLSFSLKMGKGWVGGKVFRSLEGFLRACFVFVGVKGGAGEGEEWGLLGLSRR